VYLSTNGGTTWSLLAGVSVGVRNGAAGPTTIAMIGVIDANTFIYCNGGGIMRSTNAGTSWSRASSENTLSRVVTVFNGKCYLGTSHGLLVSGDQGATWAIQGASVNIYQGPFFGADENSMVVVGTGGVYATANGGTSWTRVSGVKPTSGLAFNVGWWGGYTWDPVHNSVYVTSMNNPAYRNDLPGATPVVERHTPERQFVSFTMENATIRSAAPFDRIEMVSLAGRMLYDARFTTPRASATVPACGAPAIIRLSTSQGPVCGYRVMQGN
jgi:hypothetical protein